MVVDEESEVSLSKSMSERSKRRVVLHIVRYLVEIRKRFSEEDHRDIIYKVLHHQRLNEDMGRIKFSEKTTDHMKERKSFV
mgnify:CR=1 FL=1